MISRMHIAVLGILLHSYGCSCFGQACWRDSEVLWAGHKEGYRSDLGKGESPVWASRKVGLCIHATNNFHPFLFHSSYFLLPGR
jgi:hypothetical protein